MLWYLVGLVRSALRHLVGLVRSALCHLLGLVRPALWYLVGLVRSALRHLLGLVRSALCHLLGLVRSALRYLLGLVRAPLCHLLALVLLTLDYNHRSCGNLTPRPSRRYNAVTANHHFVVTAKPPKSRLSHLQQNFIIRFYVVSVLRWDFDSKCK